MNRDVLVIGGGPVGLTTALLLARHGLRVVVIEQRRGREFKLGAVALDDESLRIWQSCGLADYIREDWSGGKPGQVVCEYLDRRGRPFIQISRIESDFGYPQGVSVDLSSIFTKLRRRVEHHPSIELYSGCVMNDIEQDNAGVRIRCLHENNSAFVLEAAWAVACDGRNSKTRELLGIRMLGNELPEPWLVADFDDPQANGLARFSCVPGRTCVTVPLPNSKRRIERMLTPDLALNGLLDDELKARELLSQAWDQACHAPIRAMAIMRFHAGVAEQWRKGRVLLAGDAAHLTPPFAGQGLATGLRDAANLSFKISGVQRGWLAEEVIETYESERRPHQQRMIDLAIRLGRIMSPCSQASAFGIQALIRTLMRVPGIRNQLLLRGEQTRPIFRTGFIDPGGLAGQSIPQPWVLANGTERIRFDELLGPRMTWIATGQGRNPPDLTRSFLSSDDTMLIENRDFKDPDRVFQKRFGTESMVLVRPDHVVKTHITAAQAAKLKRSRSTCCRSSNPAVSASEGTAYSLSQQQSPH